MSVQGKILTLLQDGSYFKIGSNQKLIVDVRVMATTSKDVKDYLSKGALREDLYYRLNVVPIEMPPLRKRKADIITLIDHFSELTFTDNVIQKLKSHQWPGNIKQLNNVLEWIALMNDGKNTLIDVEDLPQEFQNSKTITPNNASNSVDPLFVSDDVLAMRLREARECFERYYLLAQVNKFDGNISKTAEFIGMERSALHRKLKTLEVFSDEKQNVA